MLPLRRLPWRWRLPSAASDVSSPSSVGKLPDTRLLLRSSRLLSDSWPSVVGKTPQRAFCPRLKKPVRCVSDPSCDGIPQASRLAACGLAVVPGTRTCTLRAFSEAVDRLQSLGVTYIHVHYLGVIAHTHTHKKKL